MIESWRISPKTVTPKSMAPFTAMPLGLLIAGPVAEKYGVAQWFLISGAAIIIIILISAAVIEWIKKSAQ